MAFHMHDYMLLTIGNLMVKLSAMLLLLLVLFFGHLNGLLMLTAMSTENVITLLKGGSSR